MKSYWCRRCSWTGERETNDCPDCGKTMIEISSPHGPRSEIVRHANVIEFGVHRFSHHD